jgi:hypothetical protein
MSVLILASAQGFRPIFHLNWSWRSTAEGYPRPPTEVNRAIPQRDISPGYVSGSVFIESFARSIRNTWEWVWSLWPARWVALNSTLHLMITLKHQEISRIDASASVWTDPTSCSVYKLPTCWGTLSVSQDKRYLMMNEGISSDWCFVEQTASFRDNSNHLHVTI